MKKLLLLFALLGATCAFNLNLLNAQTPEQPEKLPPGAKIVRLEASPKSITLKNPFEYAQVVINGVLDNGDRIDVTRLAKREETPKFVSTSPRGQVRPMADGAGALKFTLNGQSVAVPVTVAGQKQKYDVNFVRDVMPVLARMGCNAGTCHGAQQGRNGFALSLRGYDPLFDHRALVDDIGGRRFNRAAPDRSLMLLKPSGGVAHVGGVLFQPGEPNYELLRLWIAEGVKFDGKTTRVKSIEVQPANPVIPLPGMKQQVRVLASYVEGGVRDVSAEAFIEASNTEIATVDKQGLVTAVRRGETAIMARYEGAYAATTLIVMGDRSGFAWKAAPEHNYIDTLVYEKLKQVKVLPSELSSDYEFLRRVYLDLSGLPPEPSDIRAFIADPRPTKEKRDELIDKLVGSAEYVEHWTNKWADLLQVNRKFLGERGAQTFRSWIKYAVADNMPYDRFAYRILTASGSNVETPAASYFKILREPAQAMENTTHLFLAVRFNCNKCHDHPFERWTQNQYYELAAYFAQVGRKEDPKFKGQKIGGSAVAGAVPLVEIISDTQAGEVKHDRTGAVTPPSFPFTHGDLAPTKDPRRVQIARWITSKENPYFARSYVNRVWSYLLGVGLIEPIDDIRAGNPPTNPQLLDRLTSEFVASGFNVRELIRTICKSRTYQHSLVVNEFNKDDEINYSHALARRLPAEVIFDALHRATGSVSKLPGLPPGSRAAQAVDSNVPTPGSFLELLGRPPRESACECERSTGLQLGPVLALVNGPVLNDAIKDPNNRISKLVATMKDDAKLVEELFLAIACRPPTPAEVKKILNEFQNSEGDFQNLVKEHARRKTVLETYEKDLAVKQPEWAAKLKQSSTWHVLDFDVLQSEGGATLLQLRDGAVLALDKNPAKDTYTLTAQTELTGITAFRLEVLADPRFPGRGPGRSKNGNFVLSEFKLDVESLDGNGKAKPVAFRDPKATFSQEGLSINLAIDNDLTTGWGIAPQLGRNHTAIFHTKGKVGFATGTKLTFTFMQQAGNENVIGKFRLSATTITPPVPLQGPPDEILKILTLAPEKRTPQQKTTLTNYQRANDPELARLQREFNEMTVPADARTMVAQDIAWALLNSQAFLFNH